MCGAIPLTDEATREIGNEAGGGSLDRNIGTGTARRAPSKTGLSKPIAVGVSTVLLVCTVSYFTLHGRTAVKTLDAIPLVGVTAPQAITQTTSAPANGAEESPPEGDVPSAKARPEKISKTEDDDPVELWSRVRKGNTGAEVALAKLYLQGTAVARSCEQAHVLLLAASRRRSKAADGLLAGAYAQQCP
jgi:hypothetical protein